MNSAPSLFYETKMPYFYVRIAQEVASEYLVDAPNRETAEDIALMADASKSVDSKKIIHLKTNSHAGITIDDADKAAWEDSLEKTKEK